MSVNGFTVFLLVTITATLLMIGVELSWLRDDLLAGRIPLVVEAR